MENNKHVQKKNGLAKLLTWMKKQVKSLEVKSTVEDTIKHIVSEELKSKVTGEKLNGQEYGEEEASSSKSSQIIEVKEHEIFNIVCSDNGYFVALGNNRLSEIEDNIEECYRMINEKDWKLLFNVIATTSNAVIKTAENKE